MFHNERQIKDFSAEAIERQKELDKAQKKLDEVEEEHKEKKKAHAKCTKELDKIDMHIRELVSFSLNFHTRITYIFLGR